MIKRTFRINDRLSYSSLEQVGDEMCLYPDLFIDQFNDSSFTNWLYEMDIEKGKRAVSIFLDNKDKEIALFEISFLLNPGHLLALGGIRLNDSNELGLTILNNAPRPIVELQSLLSKGLLLRFLEIRGLDKNRPTFYSSIKRITDEYNSHPIESWFDLGYLLSEKKSFFFEGKEYKTLKEFFTINGGDERIMTSYDFLTMPYINSYAKVSNFSDGLMRLKSLIDDDHKKYFQLEKIMK